MREFKLNPPPIDAETINAALSSALRGESVKFPINEAFYSEFFRVFTSLEDDTRFASAAKEEELKDVSSPAIVFIYMMNSILEYRSFFLLPEEERKDKNLTGGLGEFILNANKAGETIGSGFMNDNRVHLKAVAARWQGTDFTQKAEIVESAVKKLAKRMSVNIDGIDFEYVPDLDVNADLEINTEGKHLIRFGNKILSEDMEHPISILGHELKHVAQFQRLEGLIERVKSGDLELNELEQVEAIAALVHMKKKGGSNFYFTGNLPTNFESKQEYKLAPDKYDNNAHLRYCFQPSEWEATVFAGGLAKELEELKELSSPQGKKEPPRPPM